MKTAGTFKAVVDKVELGPCPWVPEGDIEPPLGLFIEFQCTAEKDASGDWEMIPDADLDSFQLRHIINTEGEWDGEATFPGALNNLEEVFEMKFEDEQSFLDMTGKECSLVVVLKKGWSRVKYINSLNGKRKELPPISENSMETKISKLNSLLANR